MPTAQITVRPADSADADTLAEFNCRLAAETENRQLDAATVRQGVEVLLNDERRGRYFVASTSDGRIAGQLMHTFEWSDWRNGDIWWLQSVYVHPDFRRQGVFRQLHEHLKTLAESTPGVVGLRLYVEIENQRAQQTYQSLGFADPHYRVLERMFG